MKASFSIIIVLFLLVSFGLTLSSSAFEKPLRTEGAKEDSVTGTFTLILYGARHVNDIETVAFLDLEGDGYSFLPYAPEFDYRIERGVDAKEAVERAKRFVSGHPDFLRSQLSRILGRDGATLGYEMRPLYEPLAFGLSDVLDVDYFPKGAEVTVRIKLKPEIEMQLRGGIGSKDNGH